MEPKALKKHHGVLKSIDLESDGPGEFRGKFLNLNVLILKAVVIIPALFSS